MQSKRSGKSFPFPRRRNLISFLSYFLRFVRALQDVLNVVSVAVWPNGTQAEHLSKRVKGRAAIANFKACSNSSIVVYLIILRECVLLPVI